MCVSGCGCVGMYVCVGEGVGVVVGVHVFVFAPAPAILSYLASCSSSHVTKNCGKVIAKIFVLMDGFPKHQRPKLAGTSGSL